MTEIRGLAEGPAAESAIVAAWRRGCVVIKSTIELGPHRGKDIMTFCDRKDFESQMRLTARGGIDRRVEASIKGAIRLCLPRLGKLAPEEHDDLMQDIALLMTIWLTDSRPTRDSGLIKMRLALDPDDSLPWDQRGRLSPDLDRLFGLKIDPVTKRA